MTSLRSRLIVAIQTTLFLYPPLRYRREPLFGKERSVVVVPIVCLYGGSQNIGEIVIISFGTLLDVAGIQV